MNKRGQIAIFVIVALLLIGSLILFFTLRQSPQVTSNEEFSAQAFLGQCLRSSIQDKADNLLAHGGFSNPQDTVLYDGKDVVYLCKNINYYEKCVMQHPVYLQEVKQELEGSLEGVISDCIVSLESELTRRGFESTLDSGHSYEVTLKPNVIELSIDKKGTVRKDGVAEQFDHFLIIARNPLYDLAAAAHEIARQEAQFCYFENLGYNLLYRDISITKDVRSEGTKIYTLTNKEDNKQLMIAIRGCAIPAGF